MSDEQIERAERFLSLHRPGEPLLMPNPWDAGSARLLASLGFEALATTSSGFAATLGRLDGSVTRDEALTHAAAIVDATDLPVSADLENGFADTPGRRRRDGRGRGRGRAGRLLDRGLHGRRRRADLRRSSWPPSGWPRRPRLPTPDPRTWC